MLSGQRITSSAPLWKTQSALLVLPVESRCRCRGKKLLIAVCPCSTNLVLGSQQKDMYLARIVLLNALCLAGCVSTAALSGSAAALPSNDGEGAEAATARSLGDHQQHQQPIGIVIMAQGRSGSTMLGETFRQNKVLSCPCPSGFSGHGGTRGILHDEAVSS